MHPVQIVLTRFIDRLPDLVINNKLSGSAADLTKIANDHMALGLLRALSEHGRRVPGDVSVVGFDDIPESAYFLPPLTTVRQNFGELGRRALSALVDLIHGRDPAGSLEPVAPRLVVRSSAGPPEMYAVDLGRH